MMKMKRPREETIVHVSTASEQVSIKYQRGDWTYEFSCTREKYTPALKNQLDAMFDAMCDERINKMSQRLQLLMRLFSKNN
jgi:hypothetical protein